MSVDLGISLKKGVTKATLLKSLKARLAQVGDSDLEVSWEESGDNLLSRDAHPLDIQLSGELLVRLLFFEVPPSDDEEGGVWASVEVVTRSDEAVFLMLLTAAAVAEAAGASVTDDAELLGLGRILSVESVDSLLGARTSRGISAASAELAEKIGGSPFSS